MDVDQFVKDYQAEMAPPPPAIAPGTSLRRDVPIRSPSVGADVAVPFLLALVSALVVFIAVGIIALVKQWSVGIPAIAASLFLAGVWFWRLLNWESLLWATEELIGIDINQDGDIGKPETKPGMWRIEFENRTTGQLEYLHFDTEELREKARIVAEMLVQGTPFSEASLCGRGRPLTRGEFHDLRDLLFTHGYAYWKDPRHHTLGVDFTVVGRNRIRQLAEMSTTQARIRTHVSQNVLPGPVVGEGGGDYE